MKALIKKHESKIRFALVGGINTAIDFGILFLLTSFGLNKFVANFISTSVAFIFSFFANRSFTFKSTGSI
jgi:putative flippase GtrA